MLKDNLRQTIKMSICSGIVIECDNINELMMLWYENYRDNIQHKDITYMGKELKIIYDVVTDDNGEVIEETDFITIRKDLEDQINHINSELEVK
jgi:hypothetical protein